MTLTNEYTEPTAELTAALTHGRPITDSNAWLDGLEAACVPR